MVQIILLGNTDLELSPDSFISHMVQIIHSLNVRRIALRSPLYIPHGSDNTSLRGPGGWKRFSFISHMVQIIHTFHKVLCYFHCIALYIPHGSDNTAIFYTFQSLHQNFISHMVQIIHIYPHFVVALLLVLYIPHGSDNTETEDGGTETVTPLYIPHGSDNT